MDTVDHPVDKTPDEWQARPYKVRVAAGGRIVIPGEVRESLGVKEGDELLLTVDEKGAHVATVEMTVKEIQSYFARFN